MYVIAGDTTFTAVLADNSSAQAFAELLREGPLTIEMSRLWQYGKGWPHRADTSCKQ